MEGLEIPICLFFFLEELEASEESKRQDQKIRHEL